MQKCLTIQKRIPICNIYCFLIGSLPLLAVDINTKRAGSYFPPHEEVHAVTTGSRSDYLPSAV